MADISFCMGLFVSLVKYGTSKHVSERVICWHSGTPNRNRVPWNTHLHGCAKLRIFIYVTAVQYFSVKCVFSNHARCLVFWWSKHNAVYPLILLWRGLLFLQWKWQLEVLLKFVYLPGYTASYTETRNPYIAFRTSHPKQGTRWW